VTAKGKKKNHTSRLKKLAVVALAATTIGVGVAVTQLPYFVGEKVVTVLDGDSFKIENDQTIRLASLDAPELGNCFSQEAFDALKNKILGKRVVLRDLKTDMYGRIIAMVYLNGKIVNEYMIKNGFAASTREGGIENEVIKAANDYARQNKIGIFSPKCFQIDPPNPKCSIKGNIDDRTKEKKYLTPECPDYSKTIIEKFMGEEWFCNIEQAKKAGYKESSSCTRKIPNT